MKTPLALTLLATVIGVAAFNPTQAGATGQLPDNMVEGGTYTINVDGQACVADHRTANLSWVDGETQPLGNATCTDGGTLTFTLTAHVGCENHQVDLITGEPLQVVDHGSRNRYNRIPFGGTSRLLSAVYVAASDTCGTPETTTTTAADLPPASVPTPPTTAVEVFRSDPIPPALTTPTTTVFVSSGDPLTPAPTTTTTGITEYAAPVTPMLPVTGVDTGLLATLAGLTGGLGILAMWASRTLQRRKNNS